MWFNAAGHGWCVIGRPSGMDGGLTHPTDRVTVGGRWVSGTFSDSHVLFCVF